MFLQYAHAVKPHPRIRKTIKWGGAAVTMLLVVGWIGSRWWYVDVLRDNGVSRVGAGAGRVCDGTWDCSIGNGILLVVHSVATSGDVSTVWSHGRHGGPFVWWPFWNASSVEWCLVLPLWCVALASALPTAIAWRLDTLARRRERAHLCPQC